MIEALTRFAGICLCALPVWVIFRRSWKRRLSREIALAMFAVYLVALLTMTLEGAWASPAVMLQNARERLRTLRKINFIPFKIVGKQFATFNTDASRTQILGNTVLFAPYGFFLPLLWRKLRSPLRMALMCLLLTCGIEFTQLFIQRMTDVDDIILNFAGSMAGAGLWWICHRLIPPMETLSK